MRWLLASDRAAARPLGGMTVVLVETARRLLERGDDVVWVTGRFNESLPEDDTWQGIRVRSFLLEERSGPLGILGAPRMLGRLLERTLQDDDVDAAVLHQPLAGAAAAAPLQRGGIPSIYFFHSPWAREYLAASAGGLLRGPAAMMRRRIERRAVSSADRVVVFGETMQRLFGQEHPPLPPAERVTPGVDLARFRPIEETASVRRRLGWPEEALLFLTVRRLVPRTGVDLLLEAFGRIAPEFPDSVLAVAGTGPMRAELESRARELALTDRVLFSGYLEDELLPDALAAADVTVMPSRQLEGLGLVTLEAMASGTVTAATPVGGNIELLEPFMPELVAASVSAGDLARVMGRLAARGRDELRGLGRRARVHVEGRYGWKRTTDDLVRLMEGIR